MGLFLSKRKIPPGVRFHPTEQELVVHYLKRKASGKPLEAGFVAEIDIYQFHPADLKAFACFSKELIWYFFCETGKKYETGQRQNRSTKSGFWKPTGVDKPVEYKGRTVGKRKTLVFHEGKPAKGKGERTNWIMYEYRLECGDSGNNDTSAAIVLCKIFKKKALGPTNGEQFGAEYDEDEWENNAIEPTTADHGQNSFAEMNQNDLFAANGALSLSVVHQAPTPTSNGATSDANPFHKNPTTDPGIASSSIMVDETSTPADLGINLGDLPDSTFDETFTPGEFDIHTNLGDLPDSTFDETATPGENDIYTNLGDLPFITLDDLDSPSC